MLVEFSIRHFSSKDLVQFARPQFDKTPWGILESLKGRVEWKVPVVPGKVFSEALHGHTKPLFALLGPTPKQSLLASPKSFCGLHKTCITADSLCYPNPKVPFCYQTDPPAASLVVDAWRRGLYVIVVEGESFTYTRQDYAKD